MNAVLPSGPFDAAATSVAFGSLALIDPGRWALTARRDDLLVGAAGGVFMLFFLWLIIRDAAKTEPPDEGESVH
jgi:hypothetical protein